MSDTQTREDVDLEELLEEELKCDYRGGGCDAKPGWLLFCRFCGSRGLLCDKHKIEIQEVMVTYVHHCAICQHDYPFKFVRL